MKRGIAPRRRLFRLDSTEFLLLVSVTLVLLVYFGVRTGLLPNLLDSSAVLGAATGR